METTLVTGATGLVGFNIVQALLKRNRKVTALVRSLKKGREILPPECDVVQGDVTDPASLTTAMKDCASVYHAAGFPEQWMKDPDIFQRVNVDGTKNIIDAALSSGVQRFIYTSTIDVFAAGSGETYDERAIDTEPKGTYYERSKQAADQLVTDAINRGLPAIFLHPAGVYGPGPTASPGINDFIQKLHRRAIPLLLPGGFPVVFAPDVGEGHVLAEEKAEVGSRFILSESYCNLPGLAEIVLAELGTHRKVPPVMPVPVGKVISVMGEWIAQLTNKPPLVPKGQLHFLLWDARPQNRKAKEQLGWSPTPIRQGIRETISFLKLA
ncbi:MAG: NAD-dependent epimerase/dehydratase family protein [Myxococcota bacterium]|nr:NAD-dependent epimerase/dehydratase family protein [Myxococcota bacterium]